MIDFDIVIATFNSAETLRRCLESVREICDAVSPNIVVVDGASTDKTLEIAGEFEDIISVVVSEPDSGIYDAWNKGLTHCKNSWVLFLGSDDYLCPEEFKEYVSFVELQDDADYISCCVRLVNPDGSVIREVGRPWNWTDFRKYMCALHPGSFTSADYIRRTGGFDDSLRICGDYELLLRAGPSLKTAHWSKSVICMQVGGVSDGISVLNETLKIKLRLGHRGRIMSIVDYSTSLAKYLVRSYILGSR
jgi:glycosyltransferase involved in cell wall biosynthesis